MSANYSHLDRVAEAFGLGQLPKAVRDALIEEIDVMIFRSVLFRVMTNLSEEDKNELHEILENAGDDFEKPYNFLKTKTNNFDEIMREEVRKMKSETLALTQQFV